MAVKTIAYTVDSMGINPKVRLDGGVQGDHRITDLEFTVEGKLYEKLKTKAATIENGKIYYRFDMYNGEGDFESTVPQELASNTVVFPLEEWITRYGGIIKVLLVFTVGESTETLQELYSFPAVLSLKSRPTGSEPSEENYRSMTLMSVETTKAAKQAADDAKSAAVSAEIATNHANALKDAEVIFKSALDDEGQPIPFELTVDNYLSSESSNPVQNKTICAVLGEYIKNEEVKALIEEMKSEIKLAAHPIGSYYWSSDSTEPSILFGGVWEQIKDTFLLSAGDNYSAGSTGGEETHTLTTDEIPSHYHDVSEAMVNAQQKGTALQVGAGSAYGLGFAHVYGTSAVGSNQPHNNMPPYVVAYCWKRIA